MFDNQVGFSLLSAINSRNQQDIKSALCFVTDPNMCYQGYTPLIRAVITEDYEVVNIVLTYLKTLQGFNINQADIHNNTVLDYANRLTRNRKEIVSLLQLNGAKSNKQKMLKTKTETNQAYNQKDILFNAIQKGDLKKTKQLIEYAEINLIDVQPDNIGKKTPLIFAAAFEQWDIVQYLANYIAKQPDSAQRINAIDKYGYTALHYACQHWHNKTIKQLIECGSDVNQATAISPIDESVENCTPLIVLLISAHDPHKPDMNFQPIIDCANLLIQKGAKNISNSDNRSPIHVSVLLHNTKLFKLIYALDKKNLNTFDQHYRTPMMKAAYSGNLDVIQFLIKKNANLKLQDREGMTALHHLVQEGIPGNYSEKKYFETIKLMRPIFDMQDNEGDTALHFAASNNDIDTYTCLKNNGANLSIKNELKNTAETELEIARKEISLNNNQHYTSSYYPSTFNTPQKNTTISKEEFRKKQFSESDIKTNHIYSSELFSNMLRCILEKGFKGFQKLSSDHEISYITNLRMKKTGMVLILPDTCGPLGRITGKLQTACRQILSVKKREFPIKIFFPISSHEKQGLLGEFTISYNLDKTYTLEVLLHGNNANNPWPDISGYAKILMNMITTLESKAKINYSKNENRYTKMMHKEYQDYRVILFELIIQRITDKSLQIKYKPGTKQERLKLLKYLQENNPDLGIKMFTGKDKLSVVAYRPFTRTDFVNYINKERDPKLTEVKNTARDAIIKASNNQNKLVHRLYQDACKSDIDNLHSFRKKLAIDYKDIYNLLFNPDGGLKKYKLSNGKNSALPLDLLKLIALEAYGNYLLEIYKKTPNELNQKNLEDFTKNMTKYFSEKVYSSYRNKFQKNKKKAIFTPRILALKNKVKNDIIAASRKQENLAFDLYKAACIRNTDESLQSFKKILNPDYTAIYQQLFSSEGQCLVYPPNLIKLITLEVYGDCLINIYNANPNQDNQNRLNGFASNFDNYFFDDIYKDYVYSFRKMMENLVIRSELKKQQTYNSVRNLQKKVKNIVFADFCFDDSDDDDDYPEHFEKRERRIRKKKEDETQETRKRKREEDEDESEKNASEKKKRKIMTIKSI